MITSIRRSLQKLGARLEYRPNVPWLRWLENAPEAVRQADQTVRHSLVYRQLPWGVMSAVLLGMFSQLGMLTPFWVVSLSLPGLLGLLWPIPVLRLARVCHRNIPGTSGAPSWQLRAYAALNLVIGCLMACVILGMVAADAFVAIQTSLWAGAWPQG